jgi:S1-C subfamily serine protease
MVGDLRNPTGVIVVARAAELISPETGLRTGDVIHSLNTHPIDSVETLRTVARQLKSGDAVALQIERDGGYLYLAFEME